ncbi:hypothetical protein COT78_03540 [Candidatus Berkelbacteria bacterium CG10_big_fil_rev_8_21_14_0_10_43_13]|uniref:Uncharacterized protein n=1 Tax=Candidatus Berkelbacteria bacterium CG10_big_fil_rev_8_21_14_0_10_43_13 TaxID=1974514 RepID=A0A2H0W5T3_9BACT|nr:MAG: hypothetical protein COT78_03540 [Candidatus Berkelbacteria bacterium CG10_big_fil_rev_8_21_14_0_10_43_13]
MSITKQIKDHIAKLFFGGVSVPRGLYESSEYFRMYGAIHFKYDKTEDCIVAKSSNFKWGTIITEGKDEKELDRNIKDAILTAFEIPSSYSKEASIARVGSRKNNQEYAIAK